MQKSINFFASGSDLRSVVVSVESKYALNYVSAGMFDDPPALHEKSLATFADFGVAVYADQNRNRGYLVVPDDVLVVVRRVPQRNGSIRHAVDQRENPKSVFLRPGGVFESSCVIAGQVGTVSTEEASLELANEFARVIRKRFRRINSYYVGSEAQRLMDQGYRLTADARMPDEYDLAR